MIAWTVSIGMVALAVAVVCGLWRVARGPTTLDRILAFDALVVFAAGFLALASVRWETPHLLELVLVIAALGFFTTVALFYYLNHLPEDADDFDGGGDR